MWLLIPLLIDQYIKDWGLGIVLTFFSVMCLTSIDEVAKELENPFRNIPNELPVVTYQAEFNEALITMYGGFHPDSFWDPPAKDKQPSSNDIDQTSSSFEQGQQCDSGMPTITENSSPDENLEGKEVRRNNNPGIVTNIDANSPPFSDCNKSGDKEKMNTQLRLIVEQQGQMMEQMMTEQRRLNKMLEEILSKSVT